MRNTPERLRRRLGAALIELGHWIAEGRASTRQRQENKRALRRQAQLKA